MTRKPLTNTSDGRIQILSSRNVWQTLVQFLPVKFLPKITLMLMSVLVLTANLQAIDPYLDASLPVDTRVKDLISKMTLAEKISQLGHQSSAISRLGVKSYNYWVEGLHGVARLGLATSFPMSNGLAATWDTSLIYKVASVISDEARVKNNTGSTGLTYWCPVVNMDRDPRWGREEESFGEDNHLSARLAVNYIKGMQGNDSKYFKTVATAKHFALNNVEENRYGISSDVDERSFREYYLPVFKACVQEGNAYSIMSAYNAVNGVPCPANRTLLTNILRNEWGFKGFVVSDCDAVYNVSNDHKYVSNLTDATAVSIRSGNDLNCRTTYTTYSNDAINKKVLKEADIDSALFRVFRARFLLGEFDAASSVSYTSIASSRLDCQANRDMAVTAAQKAIVLLKNQKSFLPLDSSKIHSIAIIGPNANVVQLGEYSGAPSVQVSPLRGIANYLGIDVTGGIIEAETFDTCYIKQTKTIQSTGSIVYVGYLQNNYYLGFYNKDYPVNINKLDINIATIYDGTIVEVYLDAVDGTGTKIGTATIPNTTSWYTFQTLTIDVTPFTGKHNIYFKCLKGTSTSTRYLFNINSFKFYNSTSASTVSTDTYSAASHTLYYAQGATVNGAIDQTAIDKAVAYAQKSDLAILVCGTDVDTGSEDNDRSAIGLPGAQESLVQAVYNANPNTILVLVNGFSLAVNWEQENLPAILTAWFDGQAQGTAIADVLFGKYNPAGRLPSTWYKSTSDIPSKHVYDIIKNNRTYMYSKSTPLYPFGHGLSYSTFEYSNLTFSSNTLSSDGTITVTADIKNSSLVDGEEVPQMYIHVNSSIARPIKQLKGFSRISIPAGTTQTVSFNLKYADLEYYDATSRTFKVENGTVDVYVGSSSNDIRLTGQISATEGTTSVTYRQDPFSVFEAENYENKSATVAIKPTDAGGLCIDSLSTASWVAYKNLNFKYEAKSFYAQLSATETGGTIEVVLDSLTGTAIGTLNIVPTGSSETFVLNSTSITSISGVHDIYLIFKGSASKICRLDWFRFKGDQQATVINWDAPQSITCGTALSSAQLNATAVGNTNTAQYSPASGTILPTGTHTLTVLYAADFNYAAASKSVVIEVTKAPSAINWETPSAISYGTPLTELQLNATVTGTSASAFYSPSSGTILSTGTHTLTVNFAADNNYYAVSKTVNIVVTQAPTKISWNNPSSIEYGTALGTAQLNAVIDGSSAQAVYSPSSGSKLSVGTHTLLVEVASDVNFEAASKTVSIDVLKAPSVISWNKPSDIVYGTAIGSEQLNATVTGTSANAVYSQVSGTILNAGTHTLSVSYASDANYEAVSTSVSLTVTKAASTINWGIPSAIVYGTALSDAQLNATVSGTTAAASYTPSIGTILNAGTHNLKVEFATDNNFEGANKTVELVVNKGISVVSWENPTAITAGTALSNKQLNATVTGTSGAATYSPAVGSVLTVGTHTLSVEFASDENYNSASKTVSIKVSPATETKQLSDDEITIYPNPISDDVVNIALPSIYQDYTLTILSMSGNVMLTKHISGNRAEINLKNLNTGSYLFQINTSGQKVTKQVIKK